MPLQKGNSHYRIGSNRSEWTPPLIGFIDGQRALSLTQKLLHRIVTMEARCVIVDMTGTEIIDTMAAGHLVRMLRAAETLGSFCVVTGIGADPP